MSALQDTQPAYPGDRDDARKSSQISSSSGKQKIIGWLCSVTTVELLSGNLIEVPLCNLCTISPIPFGRVHTRAIQSYYESHNSELSLVSMFRVPPTSSFFSPVLFWGITVDCSTESPRITRRRLRSRKAVSKEVNLVLSRIFRFISTNTSSSRSTQP